MYEKISLSLRNCTLTVAFDMTTCACETLVCVLVMKRDHTSARSEIVFVCASCLVVVNTATTALRPHTVCETRFFSFFLSFFTSQALYIDLNQYFMSYEN